ncbi:MAG: single-stranded DNA-binding protein [Treponema sp.]|nr:single-stranded DNA-binding protein [Treponema sp.]
MADLNHVTVVGRLTRDASLKFTTNGKAVSKFTLAVNEKRKDGDHWKDSADFFDFVIWGQLAESLQMYLKKGKQIGVIGKLSQERWTAEDGQNRSKTVVTVQYVQLFGGGNTNSDNGNKSEQESFTTNDDGFSDEIPL